MTPYDQAVSLMNPLDALGVEVSEGIILNGIADFDGVAADFTVFDVGVTAHRKV